MGESRRMRWEGYVARMGDMTNAYKIFIGKPEKKRPLRRCNIDGKIILERISEK
jgi:hypothetical protein